MKKQIVIMILFILNHYLSVAQKPDPALQKTDNLIQEYIQLSRLGPGYSRDMSEDIVGQFTALFERDAFLYWDLYRSAADSLRPPLPVREYVALAWRQYHSRQPVLDYPSAKIRIGRAGDNATVYLKKINKVMDQDDRLLYTNRMDLLVRINLAGEHPRIRNIFENKRITTVRCISGALDIGAWSNVYSSLDRRPVVRFGSDEQFSMLKIDNEIPLGGEALVELRVNKESGHDLIFITGISFSRVLMTSVLNDYSLSYPDTLGQNTSSPFTCTTFERSQEVYEKMTITEIGIPLLFKSYINEWMYVRSGAVLGYATGRTEVGYLLSRTGGGTVTDLTTHEQYYLDKDHELDQSSYGYYRDKDFRFTKEKIISKPVLSLQFSAGFEKQFGNIGFGLEPNISVGMNPLSRRSLQGNYHLDSVDGFHSILETTNMTGFEVSFGLRVMVSYVFN